MSDERFDAKIDDVAREMTRGELPPDFRARVIARIESGNDRAGTWPPAWVLAPLAVAAIVLLAVLVVRAPEGSEGRAAQQVRDQVPGEVRLKPVPRERPNATEASRTPAPVRLKPDKPSYVGSDLSRIASAELTSAVPAIRLKPDATYEGAAQVSDLAPAPIEIKSLDVEAVQSMAVAPPRVDAMESIDVPRLEIAPLEVPAIAE